MKKTLDYTHMVDKKRMLRKLTPSGSVKQHFQDYCASTSIHGVKYVGQTERPVVERIWWTLILILSLLGNSYLMHHLWIKWNESPIIVSFDEMTTPVWQIPFPAVTLCSETKSRSTIYNFTEAYNLYVNGEYDEELIKKINDLSLFCDDHIFFENGTKTINDSTIDFLLEVAPPFEDTVYRCAWMGPSTHNCSHLFTPILTDVGLCFSFNMLPTDELFREQSNPYYKNNGHKMDGWTLEGGYPPDAPLDTYPHRTLSAGAKVGLNFVLKAMLKDLDYICRGTMQGFRILLHHPAEIPNIGEFYLRAPLGQEIVALIQPNVMKTSDGLRSYPSRIRQCYFQSDRYLSHFKVYTQKNCKLECLTNFTLKECGCVGLHMPRSESTKVCGGGSKHCMLIAAENLKIHKRECDKYLELNCDCLPACTSIQYDAETSQADFKVENVARFFKDNITNTTGSSMSRVSIFFKDMQFTTCRRSELYGTVDFLANCGGLLGLLCGVSLLSLVEIIYYVTLILWGNIKHTKKIGRTTGKIEAISAKTN